MAAALALGEGDWLFPTYRDSVAVIGRGVSPADAMVLLKGDWHSGYDVRAHRVAPQATPLATQLLHAVGFAQAAKHRGEDTVVLALCGDGATSEGDFHEAMNFAALVGADVFHVGQGDLRTEQARAPLGDDVIVGRSTHSAAQARDAEAEAGLDYFCVGPVWETPTKPGRPAVGLDPLRAVAATRTEKPWFAIGGVAEGPRLDEVIAAGATRVVVVRAVTDADDPETATRRLRARLP